MRHYGGNDYQKSRLKKRRNVPGDPAPDNRIHAILPGPHYPVYRLTSQLSRSMIMMVEIFTQWKWKRRTSNAMWSLPTRISSSCFPTMFFFGQLVSSSLKKRKRKRDRESERECNSDENEMYFVISLCSTMRLSSFTTNGPTHTVIMSRNERQR